MRILLLEDSEEMAKMLLEWLKDFKHEVTWYIDPKQFYTDTKSSKVIFANRAFVPTEKRPGLLATDRAKLVASCCVGSPELGCRIRGFIGDLYVRGPFGHGPFLYSSGGGSIRIGRGKTGY